MRKYINQLRENDTVQEVYQLSDKQLRPNKNGVLYLQFQLSDKTGTMSGRIWNVQEGTYQSIASGDYVRVDGVIQRFQSSLQFIGKSLIPVAAASLDVTEFQRHQIVDVASLRTRLQEHFRTLTTPALCNLADCFLIDTDFMTKFCAAPAGVRLHHAWPGGLLEHTVTMMDAAAKLAPLYPQLNRDIFLFGTFLHDIGKIDELEFAQESAYSSQGQLLGHSLLGTEILTTKMKESEKLLGEPFSDETAMILKHIIVSHHGTLENGSSKLPMTLEAVAIHSLDLLDSKMAELQRYITDDPNTDGLWTNYMPAIDRKLYKGHLAK